MSYLISGSVVMDSILQHNGSFKDSIIPEKISNLNVSFDLQDVRLERGGTGANILYNALKIPVNNKQTPYLFTYVGNDFDQNFLLHFPENNIKYLQHISNKKGASSFILNAQDGNQITSFYQGAMATDLEISKFPIDQFEHFLLSPDNPKNTISIATLCHIKSKSFYFDPGQCTPIFIKHYSNELINILKNMTGLFVNEYEKDLIEEFTKQDINTIFNSNAQLKFIIVTLGDKGFNLYLNGQDNPLSSPCATANKIVDPTGCGDAFRAGFMHFYIEQNDISYACHMGSVLASFAIESFGGQNHVFNHNNFAERQKKYQESLMHNSTLTNKIKI